MATTYSFRSQPAGTPHCPGLHAQDRHLGSQGHPVVSCTFHPSQQAQLLKLSHKPDGGVGRREPRSVERGTRDSEGPHDMPDVMGQGEHGGCSPVSGCRDVPASPAPLLRDVCPAPREGVLVCKHAGSEMTKG